MQIGIVGLPFSGKSTLFQTITRTHFEAAAQGKTEAHHAMVKVPDSRLDKLTEIFQPKRKVNATIEFVDVAGLKKGESGSTQFSTNFLGNVKTNDALVQVVRCFANEFVAHPDGSVDAARDIATFETEFILSDLGLVENRIEKIKKQLLKMQDELLKKELPVLERCRGLLESETPLRDGDFTKEDAAFLRNYQFLSAKPMLIALNLDESQRGRSDAIIADALKGKTTRNTQAVAYFGQIEMDISELPEAEAGVFMAEYGIKESALTAIIRASYDLLGLHSFFTVGEDETRAWTIRKDFNAQEAAGAIHSDFYARFIRAEVVAYDHFIACGSFAKTKEAGHWRLEGKEYVVKDGDILNIRHG